jgi:DNA segregation ATPase FtsK/SpoIIIE-like protein
VVALESDREYGLNVLRALTAEMVQRGRLYAGAAVSDFPAYRQHAILPRLVLIIDECF